MFECLRYVWLAAGAWCAFTAWTGWYSAPEWVRYAVFAIAVALVVLGTAQLLLTRRGRRPSAPAWAAFACGVALVACGVAVGGRGGAPRTSEVLGGLLVAATAWVAAHLPAPAKATMLSREGQQLMEVSAVLSDDRGIGMKGKMLGTMPATVYVTPEAFWRVLALVSPGVIRAVVREVVLPHRRTEEPAASRRR